MPLVDDILDNYFATHKELIETEQVDEDNVIVSFPLHTVGHHRVEVSVTKVDGTFVISDIGRTISELKEYGYSISRNLVSRMTQIAKPANVRIVNENLIMDCRPEQVGAALHSFAETAKTIGDAYLAFHVKTPSEKKLLEDVARLLEEMGISYRPGHKVDGNIEKHSVDFYVPPNGHPGLALEVLGGINTHQTAQIWYFKCSDMRLRNDRLRLGLIYDIDSSAWSPKSQKILENGADFALPSSALSSFPSVVKSTVF